MKILPKKPAILCALKQVGLPSMKFRCMKILKWIAQWGKRSEQLRLYLDGWEIDHDHNRDCRTSEKKNAIFVRNVKKWNTDRLTDPRVLQIKMLGCWEWALRCFTFTHHYTGMMADGNHVGFSFSFLGNPVLSFWNCFERCSKISTSFMLCFSLF